MFSRFIDADHTSSAFSIGFAMLAVSYFNKSNASLIIGLIFISIGLFVVNEYSLKNIAQTLKLIYYVIIPMEMVMAAYAFGKIDMSYFFTVTFLIALPKLIVIIALKRRIKYGKDQSR